MPAPSARSSPDQLVERLYRLDEGWVIKGATALLARRISARHTIDIDIYRAGAIADVERQLRDAASLDIGDWMRFEVGPSVNVRAAGAQGARIKVQSFIGTKTWAAFQVDLVADGIQMTGKPDTVLPLTAIEIGDHGDVNPRRPRDDRVIRLHPLAGLGCRGLRLIGAGVAGWEPR